jgi:phosphoserine phosphatase RsbU/P
MQTFVSAFYMVADLNKSELSYASAGHPAPIFIRRSEHLAETLSFPSRTPRPALGLFQDSNYQTSSAPLAPEDLLILYTDGLYEVEGANEEYFGQQRLLEAVRRRVNLAPSLLIDEVLGEVRDFSIRSEPDDDICLVGMEVAQTGVEVENPQIREELVRTA